LALLFLSDLHTRHAILIASPTGALKDMNATNLLLAIGVAVFIIYAIVNIIYLNDLRKTTSVLRQFIIRTDENLQPALIDMRSALQDIRRISGDLVTATERVRSLAATLGAVEKSIRVIYGSYREGIQHAARSNVESVKAGLKAGVLSLFRNMRSKTG
jgi:hypothetical protein